MGKSLNQLKTELRQMKAPRVFKLVMKEKTILNIVYEDREEIYELKRSDSYKSLRKEYDTWDRYESERMCKENGYREIHYKED